MRKIYLPAIHFRTLILFASFLLFAFQAEANTYYLTNAAKTNAQLPASWNTNPAGGGTAATNFTTAGDIFIIPTGIAGTFASNTASTFASGVTLLVDGSFTVGSGANNAVTIVTINGTIIFSNTGSTQVTLPTGGNPGTSTTFTLGSSGTLKTVNANGISGTNCSLPANGGAHTIITLPNTADYEFNGTGAQATLGLPSTVNTLTINNAAGVSLSAAVTASTLTIGSVTANSILNDNGKQITSTGTLNLSSGTFNIGSGATATSYPAFSTNTIAAGTTVNYNSSASQTIAAVDYGNLTNTGNGPRILASSGAVGIKGTFSPGNGTYTITGSTISFNGTTAQTIPAFNYNNLTVANTNTNITLAGSGTIGIAGTFIPGASTFGTVTGSTISFNGTSTQSIPAFTFHNLIINNAAGISSLGGDITINQSLALTNGIVTTGSNKVIISNSGSVSRTNGWVAGNLQKYISSTTPITFEIGSSNGYRPLIINFSTITTPGNLIASATQSNGLHSAIATSGLNSSKTILRYWNLISSGLAGTYDATFGFVAADIPVGAATGSFVVRNYNSTWITSTTGTTAGTSTQATALTTFGEFSIGETAGIPTISTQPSNATICAGSNTSFTTSSGSNPTPTVKWQRSTDGGTIWEDIIASMDGSIYTNFTTGTLIITNATVTVTGYKYRTVYTNINGAVNSNAATLIVTTLPTATITYGGSPFSDTLSTPQSVTLNGTAAYTTGIYSATPAGLTINSANGDITPSTSTVGNYTVTYTIAAAGGCSLVTATTNVTITLAPTADISYAGSPFCKSVSAPQSVTRTGTGNYTGGTYTSTSGLTIDPATGAITPSTSTPGIYTVTYNIPASAPFPASTTTVDIIITAVPTAAISYVGGPFCTSDETVQTVTLTGTGAYTGGTYLSSPSGLSLDAVTGAFLPSASAGKSYTIAYIIPATGGCAAVPVTTTINIVSRPDASLSYPGSPFCQATTSASPTLTGTSGGTYSANAGLTINSSTGVITPGTSTPGDYIVLYTIPASGPCGEVQISATVSIVASPTGSIDYAGQPFCTAGAPKSVALSGTDLYLGGIFSGSSGLIIDPVSGDITPAASTPGMYTVTYITPNCPVTFTTSVEITPAPTATITYPGNPFCQSDGALKTVTLTGDNSGEFSAPSGLSINSVDGSITASTSTAGTYLVTYTIPAAGTCSAVTMTTSVTITAPPTANINYANTPFCKSLASAQPVTLNGTNAYTGGTYSSAPGLFINSSTGAITPGTSTAGTYLVTYTVPATGGCSTVPATTSVTITDVPTAIISYAGPFCVSDASSYPVNLSGTGAYSGGSFTSNPSGLSIDGSSGMIVPNSSVAGTYTVTYTIPSSGGCSAIPVNTSVTINADAAITLSSAIATASQTVCINNAITNITYAIGGSGTGASITAGALPAGVNGSYSAGVFTISGTPTASGTFNYTVTTAGPCVNTSLSGTITVNANSIISLSSAASTASQTVCINNAITNITYGIGGSGTGASITAGTLPTGVSGSYSAGVFTISGTPTSSGTFNYTVTTSGPCVNNSLSGSITVRSNSTISLSSVASTASQTLCINNAITNITYAIGGSGTGASITAGALPAGVNGSYNAGVFTISGTPTASGTFNYTVTTSGPCVNSSLSGTITINPGSVGGTLSPSSATGCYNSNSGTITLSGQTGSVIRWELSVNGGNSWSTVSPSNTTTSLAYSNLTTSTVYRAVVQSGVCGTANSSNTFISINPPFTPTVAAIPSTTICLGQSVTLTASGFSALDTITGGDFSNANPPGWSGDNANNSNGANNSDWGEATGGKVYNGIVYSSNLGGKFMIVNGLTNSASHISLLSTPVFSTVGKTSASFEWWQAFNFNAGTVGKVEISLNGGTTYLSTPLVTYTGSSNFGTPNNGFTKVSIDLSAYLGQSNLKIRFNYLGTAGSNWALDNVNVTGAYQPVTYSWSGPGITTTGQTVTVTPAASGANVYTIITSTGGCTTTSTTVTVNVNPLPAITLTSSSLKACYSASGQTVPLAYNATNLPTPATYSITWNSTFAAVTNASLPAGQISIAVPAGATPGTYTGSLVINNANGCSSSAIPFTVTINALPIISVATPSPICVGSGTTLTVSGAITYIWSPATSLSSTTGTSVTANPGATTTYTITGTDNNGCVNTGSVTVTVNPRPTGVLSGASIICKGSSATLSLAVTGSGIISGTLSDGTSFSGTAPTITVSVSPLTTTVYSIATLTNGTCSSIAADLSGTPTVTVNDLPLINVQPSATTFCEGSNAAFSVTVAGTGLTYQWQVSADGIIYTNIAGAPYSGTTTNTLTITNASSALSGNYYRVVVTPALPCISAVNSIGVQLLLSNTWTGLTNIDWNTATNWAGNVVPTTACPDVYIPSGTPNQPTISSAVPAITNLIVKSGAVLTIDNGTLTIGGAINNSGTIIAINGGVEFNGSSIQTIAANTFQNNALKNLTISNTANTLNLAGALDLYGTLSFTGTGKTFITNDYLTLKSTATQTADVAAITVNGSGTELNFITGKVTVERFISSQRKWRFLAIPTNTTQTFHEAWQENQGPSVVGITGYGTQVTHNIAGWAAAGFDYYSPDGPSVKTWNSNTNSYTGILNTSLGIATSEGLMTFVRGDRTSIGLYATPTTTVLRTKGTLKIGDQPTISIPSGKIISVGNPYASPIDMRTISKMAGKNYTFYLYNPNINSLGAFQTFLLNADGNFYAVPGSSAPHNYIESGQAFFIASDGGDITIKENSKANVVNPLMFRPVKAEPLLRTNLYVLDANSNASLVDGVLNSFGENSNNAVDGNDSKKLLNFSENLGIKVQDQVLSIERRHTITTEDTIFLNMTKMKAKSYRFEISGENFNQPGLIAFLEDSYFNTSTPIDVNGTTTFNFNVVDVPGSWNPGRFRIVFKTASALPVTFTSVKAYQQIKDIAVEWKVENEMNMKQYEVEKSADGQHFSIATIVAAKNNSNSVNYNWLDENAFAGNNYYRIKSIDMNGDKKYSNIMNVMIGEGRSQITVYPNPVTDGNINLQLTNQPKGKYALKVVNNLGQVMMVKQIEHAEGSTTETIQLSKTAAKGNYQLEIITPDNRKVNTKLLVR